MKSFFIIAIVLLAFSALNAKILDPAKISIALNCGSQLQQFKGDGFTYRPDKAYVSGQSVPVNYGDDPVVSKAEIKYTQQEQLYLFQRHTYKQMTYSLPIRKGVNTLILKFAQMYFSKKGMRIFDVKIGDKTVIADLDVVEKVGTKHAAYEAYIQLELRTDGVYIDGSRVLRAVENNRLKVSFVKGAADNPIVNGIILVNSPKSQTTQSDYLKGRKNWQNQRERRQQKKLEKQIRQKIQNQKKKEKAVIRNDQLIIQQQSSSNTNTIGSANAYGNLRILLMGPFGICIWSGLFLYMIMFLYRFVFKFGTQKQEKAKKQ